HRAGDAVAHAAAAVAGPGRIADGAADARGGCGGRAEEVPLTGVELRRVARRAEAGMAVGRRAVALERAGLVEVDPRADRSGSTGRRVRVADRPADRAELAALVDAQHARATGQ